MNEDVFDKALREKFASVATPLAPGTFVGDVMTTLAQLPAPDDAMNAHVMGDQKQHDWVLGFAFLLGALVCVPSVFSLQVGPWLNALQSMDYAVSLSAWSPWAGAVFLLGLLFPLGLWILED